MFNSQAFKMEKSSVKLKKIQLNKKYDSIILRMCSGASVNHFLCGYSGFVANFNPAKYSGNLISSFFPAEARHTCKYVGVTTAGIQSDLDNLTPEIDDLGGDPGPAQVGDTAGAGPDGGAVV